MKTKTKRISYTQAEQYMQTDFQMFDRKTNRTFGTYKVEAVIACESGPYRKDERNDFVNVNAGDVIGIMVYNRREFGDSNHLYNTKLVKDLYDKLHTND